MSVTARRLTALSVALASVATFLASPAPGTARQPIAAPTRAVHGPIRAKPGLETDRLIVKYRADASGAMRSRIRAGAGVEVTRHLRSIKAEVVRPSRGTPAAALAALRADPLVEWAELDAALQLDADPTDETYFEFQWGLENTGDLTLGEVDARNDVDIDAAGAWPGATGTGVTVAVVDDGVDFDHPDLQGQEWTNPGETGTDPDGHPRETNGLDDDGNTYVDDVHGVNVCEDADSETLHVPGVDFHGTVVSSVIAGAVNGSGMTGVAPDARIMAVRFLEDTGGCADTIHAVRAIDYAVSNGADIINASWGGSEDSQALRDAIEAASDAGVLFVAAAGNEGTDTPHYPAAFDLPNLISVGAIQADGELASFSNYGRWVDIAAPGAYIVGAIADDTDSAFWNGTSFSAPHVAGVAALIAEEQPGLLDNAAALKSKILLSGWRNSKTLGLTSTARMLDAKYAIDFTPPVPPAFVSGAAVTGQTLPTSTVSMRLAWPAATDANGIDTYRVRYRRTGTSTWSTIVASTSKTFVDKALTLGTRYDIEVGARDRGGNWALTTTTLKPSRYQESTSLATYHGTWKTSSSSSYSGGKTRYATSAGANASFGINAKSLALVMPKGPTRGYFKLYLDGSYVKSISLYSSTARNRQVVFARNWTSVGHHTMELVVSGTSAHPRVDIDAVIAGQ